MYVLDNRTLSNLLSSFLSELKESNRSLSISTRGTDLFEYIQLIKVKPASISKSLIRFFPPKLFDRDKKETDFQKLGEKIESNSFLSYV